MTKTNNLVEFLDEKLGKPTRTTAVIFDKRELAMLAEIK